MIGAEMCLYHLVQVVLCRATHDGAASSPEPLGHPTAFSSECRPFSHRTSQRCAGSGAFSVPGPCRSSWLGGDPDERGEIRFQLKCDHLFQLQSRGGKERLVRLSGAQPTTCDDEGVEVRVLRAGAVVAGK